MTDIADLLAIMARLRAPDGCPWDREQSFKTIAPYTIEEAYEVADAIERDNLADLQDELGDLLLQVVFHSQMAKEDGHFEFADVVKSICDKMTRRHPHVFGEGSVDSPEQVKEVWNEIKDQERKGSPDRSALAGVAAGLPEWIRAEKLTKRAARVGFDWPDAASVLDKIDEETAELRHEVSSSGPVERIEAELGDLLFAVANLARKGGIDTGRALRLANMKFERRFRAMEALAEKQGVDFKALSLADQDALWDQVKQSE